ncbi:MAG: beta-glucosidase [Candidatus Goldiibacteriota bacterium HGW-Goldbacteria-1]|nr:MAG: beta-glucosidase [Candidatus Goldiibacteriota bacterium HGW-Goldbacteria-1]
MEDIQLTKGFILGTATSSYQIEGAWDEDGKGESIWDEFCRRQGTIVNGDDGKIACDHYHRYKEDVALMKKMNIMSYRFSISWPRIFPGGYGAVNEKGAAFYDLLIDELIKNGIEPSITLYHWDLPLKFHEEGGWLKKESADIFADYAGYCFKRYGDRVKMWATFNEMYVAAHLGYENGKFAPGIKDTKKALQAAHHMHLAHAKAVKAFREEKIEGGKIGIVHCMSPVHDMDKTKNSAVNTRQVDGIWNRWFCEPSLKGTYPEDIMELRKKQGTAPEITPEDMELIKNNKSDFLGINFYFRFRIYDGESEEFNWMKCVNSKPVENAKITEMGWEVYPDGLFELVKRINDEYGNIPVYVMENGMAAKDIVNVKGEVDDDDRLEYIKGHLKACERAVKAGYNLKGYYYWSLMDNFEWSSGYSKRFGIVRVDYGTQKRTIKKSGRWYGQFIENHRG